MTHTLDFVANPQQHVGSTFSDPPLPGNIVPSSSSEGADLLSAVGEGARAFYSAEAVSSS